MQNETPTRGIVVSVGNTVKDPLIVIGQEVGWRKFAGVDQPVGREILLMLREDEIAGFYEGEEGE